MRNYRVNMPGLCADASIPRHLLDAGVKHPQCSAIVIVTGSDELNLKIAVMTRFLNPGLRIICRDTDAEHRELLATVGHVTLVNPFEIFANQLDAAVYTPLLRAWEDWLVGDNDVDLENPLRPPRGNWVLCGYGRMGRALHETLSAHGVDFSIIDTADHVEEGDGRRILGRADRKSLVDANLAEAVGLVAGTNNDEENLRILLSARAVNPEAFLIVRQNRHENELAFNAAAANLIMQPSLVLARHILLFLLMPSLGRLLRYLHSRGIDHVEDLVLLSRERLPAGMPLLWSERLTDVSCVVPACRNSMHHVRLGDLLRDPSDRESTLDAIALVVTRGEQDFMLPDSDFKVQTGDVVLFCGSRRAQNLLYATVNNPYALHYLVTGEEPPRSWFFQWLYKRMQISASPDAGPGPG